MDIIYTYKRANGPRLQTVSQICCAHADMNKLWLHTCKMTYDLHGIATQTSRGAPVRRLQRVMETLQRCCNISPSASCKLQKRLKKIEKVPRHVTRTSLGKITSWCGLKEGMNNVKGRDFAKHCKTLREIARNCEKLREVARNCEALRNIARHCEKLREIARNCETLRNIVRHCEKLREIARNCETLREIARHCEKLRGIAKHCKTLREIERNCETLREIARHCEKLRGIAKHCKTSREIARHCETL
jgi:3-methyladenine DNA glycosylase Tag